MVRAGTVLVLGALALAGCKKTEALAPSADGYAALRVVQPLRVATRTMMFDLPVGTTLVADRIAGGVPLYCGMALARDVMEQTPTHVCAAYSEGTLALNPHKPFGGPPNPLPPDSVEQIHIATQDMLRRSNRRG